MRKLRKPIYFVAGHYTMSMGSGRPEFNPKKERPGLEYYIQEAGKGVMAQIGGEAQKIDEGVIGNFMAARYNHQGHLAAFIPSIDPALLYKPCMRVEGACASGGLALTSAIKSVLAEMADVVLALGVEVQNTVKAVYGADYLAGAGHYAGERKNGHAHFFPGKFSDRAGAYGAKFGQEATREAMANWYAQAIENARTCPLAQEYTNSVPDLVKQGMTPPNPKVFMEHLNLYDCSKVSDGGAGILCVSEEGLQKLGIPKEKAVRVVGYGQVEADLTKSPDDLTRLSTSERAAQVAYEMSGLGPKEIGTLEIHDCFTITAVLSMEAAGFAGHGEGPALIKSGRTKRSGDIPTNTTGGLVGYGHPTGATGVRQMVDLWKQLTGQAGNSQISMAKPHGMMINMGGNDRTVVCIIVEKG